MGTSYSFSGHRRFDVDFGLGEPLSTLLHPQSHSESKCFGFCALPLPLPQSARKTAYLKARSEQYQNRLRFRFAVTAVDELLDLFR